MKKIEKINTVTESVEKGEKFETDLDDALNIAGVGLYNVKYGLLFALMLISSIMEVIGYAYVLPAAKCDLDMTDSQRGVVASLPYFLIVITSYPWGYVVDMWGRRPTLVASCLSVGFFSYLAAFMPDLVTFTLCKLLANISLAAPSAVPYAFIGEVLPPRHRDLALSLTNALQMTGAALVPLLAYGVLPLDFSANFGSYNFRAWRLLGMLYATPFVICGVCMYFGPESPKFLVSQGKGDEALEVLRTMYAQNKRTSPDNYPVKRLKMSDAQQKSTGFLNSLQLQTLPVLRPPYLKWLCLNGFLLFGIFATLNGINMWVPDVLNRVLTETTEEPMTACQIIRLRLNSTTVELECNDTIEKSIFLINAIAGMACAVITVSLSLTIKLVGKKPLLVFIYFTFGGFMILINFITKDIVFAILLMSLQITGLGIGPVNAYAVEIFPTHLRGMAVSLGMMLGRLGSAVGTNVAGLLINNSCESTFYGFGGLLILCGVLTFLLPKSKT
ncbi:synaptic vesicle glycoprotein 2A [Plutella xylostella]|uniref:synaptic vesicle glycoprotein 2A n=1 Tax=Plutella xylostella TaxID=51655 RepID=UPI0020330FBD|nr:synaptic vesicle glycoprotein 2A [Plutella xylostella]